MDVFIFLFPLTVIIGLIGVIALLWSIESGQLDDIEREGAKILENTIINTNSNKRQIN